MSATAERPERRGPQRGETKKRKGGQRIQGPIPHSAKKLRLALKRQSHIIKALLRREKKGQGGGADKLRFAAEGRIRKGTIPATYSFSTRKIADRRPPTRKRLI